MRVAARGGVIRAGSLALTLLSLALAAYVTSLTVAFVGSPWPGFGMLPDASVAPLKLVPLRLAIEVRGLRFNDRIIAMNGQPVDGAAPIRRLINKLAPGTLVNYTARRPSGEVVDVIVPTAVFTREDYIQLCLPVLVGGLFGVLLGVVPVLARPDLLAARLFFLFNIGFAVNFAFLLPDAYVLHRLPRFGFLAAALTAGTLAHLALAMPVTRAPLRTHPRATVAVIYGAASLQALLQGTRTPGALTFLATTFVAGFLGLAANAALTAVNETDPLRRRQARVVLPGFILALGSAPVFIASNLGWFTADLPVVAYLAPLWILGALLTYAILALNLFEIDAVVRRGITFALLAAGVAGAYLAAFRALYWILEPAAAAASAGLGVILLLSAVPAIAPLRRGLEAAIERYLFPRQSEAREIIREASRELARLRAEAELGGFLRTAIMRGVASASVRLVSGPRTETLREVGPAGISDPLILSAGDPIVALLANRDRARVESRVVQPESSLPTAASKKMAALGVALIVPLPATDSRVGGFLLGPRSDGRLYTRDDVELLENLAAQTAVALENSRAWEEVRRLEQRLAAENVYLREEVEFANDVSGIVGTSAALRSVLAQIEQIAPTDATVLVQGETGTGKELVVRALHAASRRAEHVLVKIACAALPEQLLESELFGYERGAFTGATGRKAGRFEIADSGTIFFDDVDTLPLGVQAKLLRALQEGEVQRLGSNQVRRVDVRLIAATNRDLLGEVRAGRFREDLYYRLNVVPLRIPPLRDRTEDISVLVEHFVRQEGSRLGRVVKAVSAEALAELRAYPWPGNVRELRNVIQRALVLSRDEVLRLPGPLLPSDAPHAAGGSVAALDGSSVVPLADQVRDLKIRLIRNALAESGGNQRIAAEKLGLHRQSLTRMIRDLDLTELSSGKQTRD